MRVVEDTKFTFSRVEMHVKRLKEVIKEGDHALSISERVGIKDNVIHVCSCRDEHRMLSIVSRWGGEGIRVTKPRGIKFFEEQVHENDEAQGREATALLASAVLNEWVGVPCWRTNGTGRFALHIVNNVADVVAKAKSTQ